MSDPQWQLGREYDLLATYPAGAGGSIWLVRVRDDWSERAVKILRPELTSDPAAVDEFCELLDRVRALEHPGILVPDETVVHGNRVALVMGRAPGEDLRILLNRQRVLTATSTVLMIAELCDALAAAHAAGIAHGDVKPSNVLLEQDRETGAPRSIRLTDFGMAALAAHGGASVLPDEYQAPEAGAVPRRPTPAADMYAVGVVLYESLAGQPPFTGSQPDVIAQLHREYHPPRIPALPDQLWLLVAACLSKNPEQRPVAAELADLLREIAPTLATLPAFSAQDTFGIPRISIPAATRSALLARVAAASAMRVPLSAEPEESLTLGRSLLSGVRGVALAVCSGVVVVVVALALVHKSNTPPPETLTVGAATSPPLNLGIPSASLISTPSASPTHTATRSATASKSPSPSPVATSASPSPSPSSAPSSPPSTTAAPTASSPAASTSPTQGPVTVAWQCATNQAHPSHISKTSCIGIGSNGALYIGGIFTAFNGQPISDIRVSLVYDGQYLETASKYCGTSSCSITGGPYEPPAGEYQAYAGVDDSSHNEDSPSLYYPGG